ncbi:MAG: histidine phosphatase family protein [Salaquimonas sp.]
MLRLFILRHANTAWALPGQRDIDRELNEEGISDLAIIGGWIRKQNIAPGQVYCSTATRTRATLAGISKSFTNTPTIEFVPSFYSGFMDEYLDTVRETENSEDIMLIGHNPTCASLVSMLLSTDDIEGSLAASSSFPAGAMAAIDFNIEQWSDLKEGTGKLADFYIPRAAQRYDA